MWFLLHSTPLNPPPPAIKSQILVTLGHHVPLHSSCPLTYPLVPLPHAPFLGPLATLSSCLPALMLPPTRQDAEFQRWRLFPLLGALMATTADWGMASWSPHWEALTHEQHCFPHVVHCIAVAMEQVPPRPLTERQPVRALPLLPLGPPPPTSLWCGISFLFFLSSQNSQKPEAWLELKGRA